MRIKRAWIRSAHRYIGLAIALWVMATALTGAVLSFHRELDKALNPALFEVHDPGRSLSPTTWLSALDAIPGPATLSRIDFPAPRSPVVVAYLDTPGGPVRAYVDPSTGRLNGYRNPDEIGLSARAAIGTLYRFHSDLLLGSVGLTIVGCLGLALLATAGLGLYLWYPRGNGKSYPFRFVPRSRGIRRAYELHRVGGVYAAIPLAVMLVSGLSFAFPETYAAILRTEAPRATRTLPAAYVPAPWPDLARQVIRAHPGVAISGVIPGGDEHIMMLRFPGEFGRYGSSRITIDAATGSVIDSVVAPDLPANHRAFELLFPIHSGEIAGVVGRSLLLLLGLLLTIVVGCALAVWTKRTSAKKPAKR